MAGISTISMVSYMYASRSGKKPNEPLTAETRAKLLALGVNISGIKTEAEGKMKLREVEADRYAGGSTVDKKEGNKEDAVLEQARELAEKIGISVAESDPVDDIVDKISEKIEEMKVSAGEDFDKKSDVAYYERELAQLETAQMSQINLSATMNLTANMNMIYHGLY